MRKPRAKGFIADARLSKGVDGRDDWQPLHEVEGDGRMYRHRATQTMARDCDGRLWVGAKERLD